MTPSQSRSQGGQGPSDKELLQAHVAGDKRAFAVLFQRHYNRMWAVALRTCFNAEEAAEAIQDAMLSAHQAAPSFRGDAAEHLAAQDRRERLPRPGAQAAQQTVRRSAP